MKKTKNKKLTDSKTFWVIISFLASITLWAYVSNQYTTTITKTLTNVEVVFTGTDTLAEEQGLGISDISADTVSITIRGSRRTIGTLDSSDVKAVLDVSAITGVGKNSWSYTLTYPSDINTSSITYVSRTPETISFTVSQIVTRSIPVQAEFTGTLQEGYYAADIIVDPQSVSVTGPQAYLDTIAKAYVAVTGENVSSTVTSNFEYTLQDETGNDCSTENLTLEQDTVGITMPVYPTKTVPLSVMIIPGGGATADNCSIEISPKSVTVAGSEQSLAQLSTVSIGEVNLSDFETSKVYTFDISLSNGLILVGDNATATVTVTVNGLATQKMDVTNITFKNVPDGYTASTSTKTINVTIRGSAEALAGVTASDIVATIDMANYNVDEIESGSEINAAVTFTINNHTDVGVVGEYSIPVVISAE
jgi:YbbR domain-containing protein